MSEKVPEGWEIKWIGELGDIVTGFTPSTTDSTYWNGEIPFISPADFNGNLYVKETDKTVTRLGASKGRLLPEQSILVTCIGSLGGIAIASEECVTNQQINAVVTNNNFDARCAYYVILHNIGELERNSGTTTIPIINKTTFSGIRLPFPPLPEQKKIASILTSVDDVIENTQSQIDKLQDLKKGTMNELLTKGIGHTEFKDSELGRIPKSWRVKRLEEVVNNNRPITYGIVQAGKHIEGGIPYIRVSDMKSGFLSPKNMLRTSSEIASNFGRSRVESGDIVYALRGDVGSVLRVPLELEGANLTQGTALISQSKHIDTEFLLWNMRSEIVKKQTNDLAKGSTFVEMTLGNLKGIKLVVPAETEQQEIVRVLESIQKKEWTTSQKLHQTQSLKKSLMQDLLTGKVRVSVN